MDQLTPEEKKIGKDNFDEAIGVTRRDFLQGVVGAGAVSGAGLGAMYFGYSKVNDPVRVGVIGVGDEGNVLLGGCSPEYVQVVAIADIRPSSIHRAFHGDWATPAALSARPGLIAKAKYSSIDEAKKSVRVYDGLDGIAKMLDDPEVEAIIIALPLHLHAPVAIQAMLRGKHVLTEKLMAHNVAQCKAMARVAAESKDKEGNPIHLATGHQRHYSVLYDNAVHVIQWGMLGQLHHIRAQWHRGNLPGNDSWQPPLPGGELNDSGKTVDKIVEQLGKLKKELADALKRGLSTDLELLQKKVDQWEAWNLDRNLDADKAGYISKKLESGRDRPAMEELVRWRLWNRTGGGLMAELGSHQLDAASIFCSALRKDHSKAHPLTVHAIGGRTIFPEDRDAEDHVYCSFEFPGPEYDGRFDVGYPTVEKKNFIPPYSENPNKKIVVSYSSINGNGFGGYGEVVMGTKGTLILEKEQEVMLYAGSDTSASVGVKPAGGGFALDTQASGGQAAPVAKAAASGPVSRGYTEEIEHWAYCIRNPSEENQVKCYPKIAMGDAVIALTTNVAIQRGMKGEAGFVKFDERWFEIDSDETPDGSSVENELKSLQEWKA
ncbi:MAG: Gfo/Idh/MocA family oxidoreductase [Pirellulaceae bacterium]|nr:Gfo/Idh/MocA family oxidoreductase [Pirellulaceae bacterium]